MVPPAVRDARVAAAAEVSSAAELRADPGARPMPAAVRRPHHHDAAADVVVRRSDRDVRLGHLVGDRRLVLGQRRIAVVVHLDVGVLRLGAGTGGPRPSPCLPTVLTSGGIDRAHAARNAARVARHVGDPARRLGRGCSRAGLSQTGGLTRGQTDQNSQNGCRWDESSHRTGLSRAECSALHISPLRSSCGCRATDPYCEGRAKSLSDISAGLYAAPFACSLVHARA